MSLRLILGHLPSVPCPIRPSHQSTSVRASFEWAYGAADEEPRSPSQFQSPSPNHSPSSSPSRPRATIPSCCGLREKRRETSGPYLIADSFLVMTGMSEPMRTELSASSAIAHLRKTCRSCVSVCRVSVVRKPREATRAQVARVWAHCVLRSGIGDTQTRAHLLAGRRSSPLLHGWSSCFPRRASS